MIDYTHMDELGKGSLDIRKAHHFGEASEAAAMDVEGECRVGEGACAYIIASACQSWTRTCALHVTSQYVTQSAHPPSTLYVIEVPRGSRNS